jgi:hypothetical protein
MIKVSRFRVSDKPYAVDLGSYRPDDHGSVDAVWFRRRREAYNGPLRTVACAGMLRGCLVPDLSTVDSFLATFTDGRYGGDCVARWDGANLWSLADEADRERYKEILVPMLANYPAVPPTFDGWWVFPR